MPQGNKKNAPNDVLSMIRYTAGPIYQFYRANLKDTRQWPFTNFPFKISSLSRLLDIGCGWGRFLIPTAQNITEAYGVDITHDLLFYAKDLSKDEKGKVRLILADGGHLPFQENIFDIAFSNSVLQHLSKINAENVVKEAARTLKPNGVAWIQLPILSSPRAFLDTLLGRGGRSGEKLRYKSNYEKYKYIKYWSIKEIREVFARYFSNVRILSGSFLLFEANTEHLRRLPSPFGIIILLSKILAKMTNSIVPVFKYLSTSVWVIASHPCES